ncbi:MAG: STAS domain-containing protein [Lachnospiraceae bacterium]|nr:STAS domain-containing protein [Lachnospiraceae bacterium]
MTIDLLKNDAAATLKLAGRLDTMTAPELEATVNGLDDAVTDLVIDMTGIEYISSAGLRVLLGAQKKMSKVGSLKLTGVNDAVMEVFEITGFSDILTIEG